MTIFINSVQNLFKLMQTNPSFQKPLLYSRLLHKAKRRISAVSITCAVTSESSVSATDDQAAGTSQVPTVLDSLHGQQNTTAEFYAQSETDKWIDAICGYQNQYPVSSPSTQQFSTFITPCCPLPSIIHHVHCILKTMGLIN